MRLKWLQLLICACATPAFALANDHCNSLITAPSPNEARFRALGFKVLPLDLRFEDAFIPRQNIISDILFHSRNKALLEKLGEYMSTLNELEQADIFENLSRVSLFLRQTEVQGAKQRTWGLEPRVTEAMGIRSVANGHSHFYEAQLLYMAFEKHLSDGKSLKTVLVQLHEIAQEHARAFFRAELQTLDATNVVVNQNGVIPLNENGVPHEASFLECQKAYNFFEHYPELEWFNPEEKATIRNLAQVYARTLEVAYSDRNALLEQITLKENYRDGLDRSGNVRSFIDTNRFYASPWWTSTAYQGLATITGETSKSPLRKLYGEKSSRTIFWPSSRPWFSDKAKPNLDKVRLAINKDESGAQRSLELFVKANDGNWQPFFLLRMGDTWVPARKFLGEDVKQSCSKCHASSNGSLSPRPRFLKTAEDFRAVGYKDAALIRGLMRFAH